MIDDVIFILLKGDATVTGMVGANIFPVMADENNAEKYITYKTISTTPENTKDGVSKLDTTRVQLNLYAPDKWDADAIAAAVRNVLDHYHGTLRGTLNTYVVDSIWFDGHDNEFDLESNRYVVVNDYFIREKRGIITK
jgi:hypothetical protein